MESKVGCINIRTHTSCPSNRVQYITMPFHSKPYKPERERGRGRWRGERDVERGRGLKNSHLATVCRPQGAVAPILFETGPCPNFFDFAAKVSK